MKLCLVCSSGGHFLELHSLDTLWQAHDHFWVTFPGKDTEFFLGKRRVYWAYHPTNRSITNLIRNLFLAVKVIGKEKPDAVISTGAGVAVPFLYVGRLFGAKTVYIESLTRVHTLSLSGRLVYPIVHAFLVQWPELADKHRKAVFEGQVI